MNFAIVRATVLAAFLALFAADKTNAQALTVDAEEFKRLAAEVADLRDANSALQKRVGQLQNKIESLQDALRQANERSTTKMGDFATREDLAKMAEKIREVDQHRELDRKLILEEFDKLGKTLTQPVEKPERSSRKRSREKEERESSRSNETESASAKPIEGNFFPYKIQKGDMLESILKAYNTKLKEDGRPTITVDQVRRANPRMNPNNLIAGREILLPVPDKKK